MKAILNGNLKEVEDGTSVSSLIKDLYLDDRKIAVEINLNIIPKTEYPSVFLKEGDKIEILQFIAGG